MAPLAHCSSEFAEDLAEAAATDASILVGAFDRDMAYSSSDDEALVGEDLIVPQSEEDTGFEFDCAK